MAKQPLAPDGVTFALVNLTGAATDVDDSPDSPDGLWLPAVNDALDTDVRASFPTPSVAPNTGAGLQAFRLWVRVGSEAGGNDPTMDVALWENGSEVSILQTGIAVASHTGELITVTWDASLLGTADGSLVEVRAIGQRSGGAGGSRRTVEFGAIEWEADVTAVVAGEVTGDASYRAALQSLVSAVGSARYALQGESSEDASTRFAIPSEVVVAVSLRIAQLGAQSVEASILLKLLAEVTAQASYRTALRGLASEDASLRLALQSEASAAASIRIEGAAFPPVIMRPNADVSLGGWLNELGSTPTWSSIDEDVPSATDYAIGPA